jgi:hypothetical protein
VRDAKKMMPITSTCVDDEARGKDSVVSFYTVKAKDHPLERHTL